MGPFLIVARKELLFMLKTPRFVFAFLVLLPLFIGTTLAASYSVNAEFEAYEVAQRNESESLRSVTTYWQLLRSFRTFYRPPNASSIIALGSLRDTGDVFYKYNANNAPTGRSLLIRNAFHRYYGDWDISRAVSLVVSFLCLLLSFDAIAAEKRNGTLKAIRAQPVTARSLVLGKLAGIWTAMALLLFICFGMSALIIWQVLSYGLSKTLITLVVFYLLSLLFCLEFIVLGLLISSLTHTPRYALAGSIGLWVLLVLIVPQFLAYSSTKAHETVDLQQQLAEVDVAIEKYIASFQDTGELRTVADRLELQKHWFKSTTQYIDTLRRISDRNNAILRQQQNHIIGLSWFSPAISLDIGAAIISESDAVFQLTIEEAVWDALPFYLEYLQQRLMPDLEEALTNGQPFRSYPGGIDQENLPSPTVRSPGLFEKFAGISNVLLVLVCWAALGIGLSIYRMGRYDPR